MNRSFVFSLLQNMKCQKFFSVLALAILPSVHSSGNLISPGDAFTQISPLEITRQYTSMIQADHRLVRISSRGDIEISEDNGSSWLNRSPGVLIPLNDIVWTGNRLVAAGRSGRIISSQDFGQNWQNLPSNATGDYYSVAWTGTHLLASGINGQISQSADEGASWKTLYFVDPGQFYGTAGVGQTWAVAGTQGRIFATFDNGESWLGVRERETGAPDLQDLLFNGEVFVIVGDDGTILRGTRPDELTSVASGTSVDLKSVTQIGTRMFATGGRCIFNSDKAQTIIYSDDNGLTWSTAFTGVPGTVHGLAGQAPNLIAVGNSDFIARSDDNGSSWQVETKALTTPSDDFEAITANNGLIVGVGREGLINTSSDGGRTWSVRDSQTSEFFFDVTKSGSNLVAIGASGTVRISNDGAETWLDKDVSTPDFLLGVTETGSTLVVVGANSSADAPRAFYSSDQGETWNSAVVPQGGFFLSVAWTGSRLVAAGDAGEVMISDDEGRTWLKRDSGISERIVKMRFHDGVLLGNAGAKIIRSTDDGETWQQIEIAPEVRSFGDNLIYGGDAWYSEHFDGIIRSLDSGLTWQLVPNFIARNSPALIHDGNNLILINTAFDATYTSSDQGQSWTGLNVKTINHIEAFAKKWGRHVAVGLGGQIMTTEDGGVNWKLISGPSSSDNLHEVIATESGFIAVGSRGELLLSTSGEEWIRTTHSENAATLYGVAADGPRTVVVGTSSNALFSSDGGENWTTHPTGTNEYLLAVTYGNGQFVATGAAGVILTSPDGQVWTVRTSGTTKRLWGVTWTGSRYIAIGGIAENQGGGGIILSSEDGITWSIRADELENSPQDVVTVGSRALVVGTRSVGISDDGGLTWIINNGSLTWFNAAHWDGSVLLAGGSNKNLWRSEGNAEGLAALGLIPNLEVRTSEGQLLTSTVGVTSFPSAFVGEQNNPISFEIKNSGTAPLKDFLIVPDSESDADFILNVTGLDLVLEPGESTQFWVSFVPIEAGARASTFLINSNNPDTSAFSFSVSGTGLNAETLFMDAVSSAGLTGADAQADATPFADEVPNLLKYAFNMDLAAADSHEMELSGTSGLPKVHQIPNDGAKQWVYEYVRRKSSGLNYQPQWSSTLTSDSFSIIPEEKQQVHSIDDQWDRVSITMPNETESKLFILVTVEFD